MDFQNVLSYDANSQQHFSIIPVVFSNAWKDWQVFLKTSHRSYSRCVDSLLSRSLKVPTLHSATRTRTQEEEQEHNKYIWTLSTSMHFPFKRFYDTWVVCLCSNPRELLSSICLMSYSLHPFNQIFHPVPTLLWHKVPSLLWHVTIPLWKASWKFKQTLSNGYSHYSTLMHIFHDLFKELYKFYNAADSSQEHIRVFASSILK